MAWSAERGVHEYAICGGGPNACLVGADGAVYITQNGGTAGAWRAEVMRAPSIQKAWPDGTVEVVTTRVDGLDLVAPNDLTFGADGRLYFTDPGDYDPDNRGEGRLFALNPDGTGELVETVQSAYPNGIVAEEGGAIVWVDSYDRGVYRKRPNEASELICALPDGHIPDGLKIAEDGKFWVTGFTAGGIAVVAQNGALSDFLETGGVPLNCVFDNDSLLITDNGAWSGDSAEAQMGGSLRRALVGVRGMPLYRGAIEPDRSQLSAL